MLVLSRASCCWAARDYARVGMADERDVIINVEVSSAIFVVEILAPTANDFQGTLIRDAEIGAEEILFASKAFRPDRV